jgi:nickel-dependent lactate racemase
MRVYLTTRCDGPCPARMRFLLSSRRTIRARMPTHHLPYGHGFLDCDLASAAARGHVIETIEPASARPAEDPLGEVDATLAAAPLPAYRGGGCAIAINDRTRPVPHAVLLPPLLAWLERAGVPAADVLFIIATGTHPVTPAAQFGDTVPPEVLMRCRVISHDAHDEAGLADLGTTPRGSRILINREYVRRELRLVVGGIEPHQFVGFSGGVKSAAIGLAGRATVEHNHSMMSHPLAQIGRYEDNPCRQDIEDIGTRISVHVALNVILGEGKRIIRALAGPPLEVMRQGIPVVRRLNQVPVSAPFDLLIVSPGGYPRDVNVYQAQKALAHAALIARAGGTILIAAECPEGSGSLAYESWLGRPGLTSHAAVLERFAREGFRIGPHKAFQISRDTARFAVRWHTAMSPALMARLLLAPAPDFQAAIDDALAGLSPGSRIGLLPRANATIPVLRDST